MKSLEERAVEALESIATSLKTIAETLIDEDQLGLADNVGRLADDLKRIANVSAEES